MTVHKGVSNPQYDFMVRCHASPRVHKADWLRVDSSDSSSHKNRANLNGGGVRYPTSHHA